MNTINDVSDEAYAKIRLLARAWRISEGEAIARLVDNFASTPSPAAATKNDQGPEDSVAIYVVYDAARVEAIYDRKTKAVTIINGKLNGKSYPTPSGAAVAVVSAYNPSVNPNRNGWSFWSLSGNGELLQTIRTQPARSRGIAR